jgi:hypothetical protein
MSVFDFPVSPPPETKQVHISTTRLIKNAKRFPAPPSATGQLPIWLLKEKTPSPRRLAAQLPHTAAVSVSNPPAKSSKPVQPTRNMDTFPRKYMSSSYSSGSKGPRHSHTVNSTRLSLSSMPNCDSERRLSQNGFAHYGTEITSKDMSFRRIAADIETQIPPSLPDSHRTRNVKFSTPKKSLLDLTLTQVGSQKTSEDISMSQSAAKRETRLSCAPSTSSRPHTTDLEIPRHPIQAFQQTMANRGTQTILEEKHGSPITADRETQTTPVPSESHHQQVDFETILTSAGLVSTTLWRKSLFLELVLLKELKAAAEPFFHSPIRILHEDQLGKETVAWEGRLGQWIEGIELNLKKHDHNLPKLQERWTAVDRELKRLTSLLGSEHLDAVSGVGCKVDGNGAKILERPLPNKDANRYEANLMKRQTQSKVNVTIRETLEKERTSRIVEGLEIASNSPKTSMKRKRHTGQQGTASLMVHGDQY